MMFKVLEEIFVNIELSEMQGCKSAMEGQQGRFAVLGRFNAEQYVEL